ncbi:YjeO family protein [Proteus vulgaris]|uniref:DUF2645 family protein n=1 Tax=Proteus vulgaris TaxID=585 RepID=UPI0018E41573|nr:DUF2645 family protein [Proteus vulgaris]MBI6530648.1 YjeO family protein [Proteus vulgaris]
MKILSKLFFFLYLIFLLILIRIFSISDYEWMLDSGDIKQLCQLPLDGRYIIEPILVLIPCICLLLCERKQKLKYTYIAITLAYLYWSFFLRFSGC